MNLDTALFYVNSVWTTVQNPHFVPFIPSVLLALWGILGLVLEAYKCKYQTPSWTWTVGYLGAWMWMFALWQFYLPADPSYMPEYGLIAHVVANLIGSAMVAFVTPFIVATVLLTVFFTIPVVVIESVRRAEIFFGRPRLY